MERRQAKIRLIAAVTPHGLRIRNARNSFLNCFIRRLAYMPDQRLNHLKNLFLLWERHLQIDLRKLRLPVSTQIFIAETTNDLKVTLITAHHQQLLKDLRRLRKSIEIPWLYPARHQVIACALGGRARHEWRLNLKKPLPVQRLPDRKRDLRAHDD